MLDMSWSLTKHAADIVVVIDNRRRQSITRMGVSF